MQKNKKGKFGLQKLTIAAMLTALSIIIGFFCKNYFNFGNGLFRITFENFPIILSGILFGPMTGALVGAGADILSFVLSTQTLAISPIVTIGAALVGATAGFVSHLLRKKEGVGKIVISAAAAHLIGSVLVKSAGLYAYYGIAVLWRIPLYFCIGTAEIALICLLYKNAVFHKFFRHGEEK